MSRVLPILFNGEMVRAILDGRKMVTRRALKQPFEVHPNGFITKPKGNDRLCPYEPPYQPEDILYVRETWDYLEGWKIGDPAVVGAYFYRADGDLRPVSWRGKWRPSIHMPKEAARIWLRVTDVRVERLQDITEEQAQMEGCNSGLLTGPCTARGQFESLWNPTIKKSDLARYGWDANPWVWVIEFERCEDPEMRSE